MRRASPIILIAFFTTGVVSGCTDWGVNDGSSRLPAIVLSDAYKDGTRQWPEGGYRLESWRVDGDVLTLKVVLYVRPAAGPQLVATNYFMESSPVQAAVVLSFEMAGTIYAEQEQELVFDLGPLRDAYYTAYRDRHGTIQLDLIAHGSMVAQISYGF